MAREINLPSPVTYIQDFGLNVAPVPLQRNKRVVILGTSEDGPMYEPIQIEKPEDAEFVWGRIGAEGADLVRGIFECWDVQGGHPTVVGVRIGTGKNAVLEIAESTGSGADVEFGGSRTSLKLESLFPGTIYNQITIGYDENRNVAIYNPKTGITSTFSVDTERPTNTNVDVHNVAELVAAINADPNLNSIMVASYSGIVSDYEVAINSSSSGVINTDTSVQVQLDSMLAHYVTTSGFMISSPLNTVASAANDLIGIETVEAVSISEWEKLECGGKAVNKFSLMPLDGKSPAQWQTIQAMKDYGNDSDYTSDPSGNYVSEFIYSLSNALMDGGTGEGGTTTSGGFYLNSVGQNAIRIAIPVILDDSEEVNSSGATQSYITNLLTSTYSSYSGIGWRYATCSGIATKLVNGVATRPSGKIDIQVSDSPDPNGFWTSLPYDRLSGVYLSGMATYGGIVNAVICVGASGYSHGSSAMRSLLYSNNTIREGLYLRINANSIKSFLGEVDNLNSLSTLTTLTNYFVRGQEIVFNAPPAFDIICNYGTRVEYEAGANLQLTDLANGKLTFTDPEMLPGPGGGKLTSATTYLRFRYSYMPTWPNITTAAKVLSGGTTGTNINSRVRKEELTKAYQRLRNYGADLWVPMGAYIDDIAERYNPITGLKETIPTDYVSDLVEFLEDLSINNIQPHAILGVKPMEEVTQAAKDLWVKRLTERDLKDPNRGANIMGQIGSKFLSVVAFEPVFLNIGRGRPYVANGQAVYAGMISSIPYDISPTNKSISGIQGLRFSLSISQYEALNSNRYVTMKTKPGRDPVIIEDVTAAPFGSDFVSWSTYSITAEAANRVYNIAETFIGRPNSVEVRTSLEQLISNTLMSMSGLRAFDFSISSTPNQQVLGIIEVDLILVPVFTIKKIRTTVKLRKSLPSTI